MFRIFYQNFLYGQQERHIISGKGSYYGPGGRNYQEASVASHSSGFCSLFASIAGTPGFYQHTDLASLTGTQQFITYSAIKAAFFIAIVFL